MIIAFDPGFSGGICILSNNGIPIVFELPIIDDKKKGKRYDTLAIVKLIKSYQSENPTVVIENIHTMPGQGVSSSGKLLEGKGILIGIATAIFNKDPIMVSPQSWKKTFPELTGAPELLAMKTQIDEEQSKIKALGKKPKKEVLKPFKKTLTALKGKYKSAVKSNTRLCAIKRYPQLEDTLKLVKDDGKADALFIALHVFKTQVS